MPLERRAVIDVGTNSVKLLVAEVDGAGVRPLWEEGEQTRLGEGFYESHRLRATAIAATVRVAARMVETARSHGARTVRLIATSAAREAVNRDELVTALTTRCGLPVEIISGEQEAEWTYRGALTAPALAGQHVLVVDVGGGSSEFILGRGDRCELRQSVPLGAVRLLETLRPGDPPGPSELARCRDALRTFLDRHVCPGLAPALGGARAKPQWVGTGGTAMVLARMHGRFEDWDRERIEVLRLPTEAMTDLVEQVWSLPLAARRQLAGLPPERADVILTGAAIYEAVGRRLGLEALRVSTRGLRFAAVLAVV